MDDQFTSPALVDQLKHQKKIIIIISLNIIFVTRVTHDNDVQTINVLMHSTSNSVGVD